MIKKETVYTINGRYFVDTPIGTFTFETQLLEKKVSKSSKAVKEKTTKE